MYIYEVISLLCVFSEKHINVLLSISNNIQQIIFNYQSHSIFAILLITNKFISKQVYKEILLIW